MQDRLKTITTLQSLAIFFVVLGHSLPLHNITQARPPVAEWIYRFIYSFHIPLFIFISGFLFIYTNRDRRIIYSRFLLKKVKRLLLPYLTITTVAFLFKAALSHYAMRPLSFTLTDYVRGLLFPLRNPIIFFWFLPTIFLLLAIAPLIKRIILMNKAIVSLGLLPFLIFLNVTDPVKWNFLCISSAASMLMFFYLGCLAAYYMKGRLEYLENYYVTVVLLLILISSTALFILADRSIQPLPAIIGIAFSVSLATLMQESNLLKPIHGYYYQIFLLSWFPQVFFQILYRVELIDYSVTVGTMLLGGLFLPILISRLIAKRAPRLGMVIGL